MDWGPFVLQTLIATILSGSIVGLFLKGWLDRRMEAERFTRDWKEKSLSLLIGPVVMHLDRTKHVASRYRETSYAKKGTSFFEAQLMRDSNRAIRELLLSNGHLLPEQLRRPAHELVAHYDVWLRRFDEKAARENPGSESTFDVGFARPKFPGDAAQEFNALYEALRKELYGVAAAPIDGGDLTR
jgi:hypothetical protein